MEPFLWVIQIFFIYPYLLFWSYIIHYGFLLKFLASEFYNRLRLCPMNPNMHEQTAGGCYDHWRVVYCHEDGVNSVGCLDALMDRLYSRAKMMTIITMIAIPAVCEILLAIMVMMVRRMVTKQVGSPTTFIF